MTVLGKPASSGGDQVVLGLGLGLVYRHLRPLPRSGWSIRGDPEYRDGYERNRVWRRTSGSTNHRTANRHTVKTVMIATVRPAST